MATKREIIEKIKAGKQQPTSEKPSEIDRLKKLSKETRTPLRLIEEQEHPYGKYSKSEINKMVDSLSDKDLEYIYLKEREVIKIDSTVSEIISLCRSIISYDTSFENLNSEKDRAREVAKDIHIIYNKLLSLIKKVKEEEAENAIEALKTINYSFLRVFGIKPIKIYKIRRKARKSMGSA